MSDERLKRRLYLTRDCGTCKACCTLMPVVELDKAPSLACKHLNPQEGKGCTAYETRPESCRSWACVWRSGSNVVEPVERPDRLGVMLDTLRPLPGQPRLDVLLAYETREGGFAAADAALSRMARKRAIVFMTGEPKVFGTQGAVDAFLSGAPEFAEAIGLRAAS